MKHLSKWFQLITSIKFRKVIVIRPFVFECSVHKLGNGFSFDTISSFHPNPNTTFQSCKHFIYHSICSYFKNFRWILTSLSLRTHLKTNKLVITQKFILNLDPSIFAFFHAHFNRSICIFLGFWCLGRESE